MDRSGSFLPPYVSTRASARWLTALLLLMGAVSAISAGFEISEIRLIAGLLSDQTISSEQRWAHGVTRNALLDTRVTLVASTAVLFVMWLYRSRINARALGCRRFRYRRNWAVLGFLVPILNLIVPLQIVSEVWKASDPRATATPFDWKAIPVPKFVAVWWGMLLGFFFLEIFGAALTTSFGAGMLRILLARGITVFADLGIAVTAAMAIFVISGISQSQDIKWAVLNGAELDEDRDAGEAAVGHPEPVTASSL